MNDSCDNAQEQIAIDRNVNVVTKEISSDTTMIRSTSDASTQDEVQQLNVLLMSNSEACNCLRFETLLTLFCRFHSYKVETARTLCQCIANMSSKSSMRKALMAQNAWNPVKFAESLLFDIQHHCNDNDMTLCITSAIANWSLEECMREALCNSRLCECILDQIFKIMQQSYISTSKINILSAVISNLSIDRRFQLSMLRRQPLKRLSDLLWQEYRQDEATVEKLLLTILNLTYRNSEAISTLLGHMPAHRILRIFESTRSHEGILICLLRLSFLYLSQTVKLPVEDRNILAKIQVGSILLFPDNYEVLNVLSVGIIQYMDFDCGLLFIMHNGYHALEEAINRCNQSLNTTQLESIRAALIQLRNDHSEILDECDNHFEIVANIVHTSDKNIDISLVGVALLANFIGKSVSPDIHSSNTGAKSALDRLLQTRYICLIDDQQYGLGEDFFEILVEVLELHGGSMEIANSVFNFSSKLIYVPKAFSTPRAIILFTSAFRRFSALRQQEFIETALQGFANLAALDDDYCFKMLNTDSRNSVITASSIVTAAFANSSNTSIALSGCLLINILSQNDSNQDILGSADAMKMLLEMSSAKNVDINVVLESMHALHSLCLHPCNISRFANYATSCTTLFAILRSYSSDSQFKSMNIVETILAIIFALLCYQNSLGAKFRYIFHIAPALIQHSQSRIVAALAVMNCLLKSNLDDFVSQDCLAVILKAASSYDSKTNAIVAKTALQLVNSALSSITMSNNSTSAKAITNLLTNIELLRQTLEKLLDPNVLHEASPSEVIGRLEIVGYTVAALWALPSFRITGKHNSRVSILESLDSCSRSFISIVTSVPIRDRAPLLNKSICMVIEYRNRTENHTCTEVDCDLQLLSDIMVFAIENVSLNGNLDVLEFSLTAMGNISANDYHRLRLYRGFKVLEVIFNIFESHFAFPESVQLAALHVLYNLVIDASVLEEISVSIWPIFTSYILMCEASRVSNCPLLNIALKSLECIISYWKIHSPDDRLLDEGRQISNKILVSKPNDRELTEIARNILA